MKTLFHKSSAVPQIAIAVLVGCGYSNLGFSAEPANYYQVVTDAQSPKHHRPIQRDDVAFGGRVLEAPRALNNDGVFIDVLSIEGVRFSLKNVPNPRAFALGTLSLSSKTGTGNAIVQLRVAVDGKPEAPIFSTTVFDGFPTSFGGGIPCNAFPADGLDHTATLQVAVIGTGQVTVDTGTFEFMAFRPIWVPSTSIPTPQLPIP